METNKNPSSEFRVNEISSYLENLSLLILGLLLFAFPLVFATATTDYFTLPKQILLSATALATLLFWGAKMISDGSVRIRRTPFDFPLLIFTLVVFASSFFSINRFDSLIAFVPLFLVVFAYFVIVNLVRTKDSIIFLISAFIAGSCLISISAVLSFLKIYILPFPMTRVQTFTPMGSLLDQAFYLILAILVALPFAMPLLSSDGVKRIFREAGEKVEMATGFAIGLILIVTGFLITVYQLFTPAVAGQKPILLPFETGFQTAFAAISQDTGRVVQSFLFGSGFGTYMVDFTRFKPVVFNLNQGLWSLTFFRSSNFILELLATTGILGLLAFIFLLLRILRSNNLGALARENPIFIALLALIVLSFLLPFSFVMQTTFFLILGLFGSFQGLKENEKYFDIELYFVAFKKGIISSIPLTEGGEPEIRISKDQQTATKIMPVLIFILFLIFTGLIGLFAGRFVASDVIFQNSLVAAAANNGLQTYNDQTNAINIFPYRDVYHRIYSQTNLALANSIAASQPKDSSPSAQVQQTILTLTQQAINSGRLATAISPLNSVNWQNLSSIYRGLIGFGQNAENFAIVANQQAIILDPNNPQQYINLGGIYYQLGRYDDAQRQFQIAVNLKPDFANAYYNLGHALEQKQDYQNALLQYQTVKTLVANDKDATQRITNEIEALQKKVGVTASTQPQTKVAPSATGEPASQRGEQKLELSTPSAKLPEQEKQVEIPAPAATITPTSTPKPSASPSPTVKP